MNPRFAPLQAALERPPAGTRRLALAFSGGLDSTALLHALKECVPALPVRAIHVCHHLQPEAERWAAGCARQAAAWNLAFTRLDVDVTVTNGGLEAAARDARYAALCAELTADETLITAHHGRDQAETFLLQALRGAGPRGLAAMGPIARLGEHCHWRPWLDIDHDTIMAYAEMHGLAWIDDPSNHDPQVARSFLRESVMPQLRQLWPQADRLLARSAAHANEAAEAIDTLAAIDLEQASSADDTLDTDVLDRLGPARAKQVVRRWLARAGHDRPDHRHATQIVELGGSRLVASPVVAFADTEVRLFDGRLHAMARLPCVHGDFERRWDGRTPLSLPPGCGTLAIAPPPRADLALNVVLRRGGERVPDGSGSHRRVKDVLREARLPPWLRERMPLVYLGDTPIALGDIWRHPHIRQLAGEDIGAFVWHKSRA
ncbi:tRNA lysidine(34) synthetase TilS [Salinisphaera sp.]|uniref:tRNA lysidine(34) synthetase TilS n=1 Tax=Salinisphaera sp. TaxID=1914330 RepID=UPI000C6A820D|nr:tRNA lysidine(34) synthetase TilS [Salinisphaera sp.]MBS63050.1 tRNA lysidine(34) synthetase TilS [Salinisphaera sp.]